VSLNGTTTSNLRAVKRRYHWPLCLVDSDAYTALDAMYRARGPWWLYDSTMPSTTPLPRRLFRGWKTGGVLVTPVNGSVTLTASSALVWDTETSPDPRRLIRVTPGAKVTAAVDAVAASGTPTLSVGWKFYAADGTSPSTSVTNTVLSTTSKRAVGTTTVPAGKAIAQPMLLTSSTGVTVSAPATGGAVDPGSPRRVVLFEGLEVLSYNGSKHALTISLREV
jgi:hypothetical protein